MAILYTRESMATLTEPKNNSQRYWRCQARRILAAHTAVSTVEVVESGRKTDSAYVGERGKRRPPQGVVVIVASTGGRWGRSRREYWPAGLDRSLRLAE